MAENSGSSVVRRSDWKRRAHTTLTQALIDLDELDMNEVRELVKAGDQMFGKAADWDDDAKSKDLDDDDDDGDDED